MTVFNSKLRVTSPHKKGEQVKQAQHVLNNPKANRLGRDLLRGNVDGDWGPLSEQATRRAQYLIGYAPKKINGIYTPNLHAFLIPTDKGGKALPRVFRLRRAIRLRLERQKAARAAKRKQLLAVAALQIGTSESPPNSNKVKYSEWYGMIGPWCHPAGTLIKMADGTHKPIESVEEGEWVYTAEGNVGFVSATGERHTESVKMVKFMGGRLMLTPEHPILTQRGYVPASEITTDDRVAIPRIHREHDDHFGIKIAEEPQHFLDRFANNKKYRALTQLDRCPSTIQLNEKFGRLAGLYLAEGSVRTRKRNTGELKFTFSSDEMHLVEETVELLRETVGADGRIVDRTHIDSTYDVIVRGQLWAEIFKEMFGSGSRNKRVCPAMMNAPLESMRAMLWGWIEGDGWKQNQTISAVSASKNLAMSMFDIANALGYEPSLNPRPAPDEARQPTWTVSFQDPNREVKISRSQMDDSTMWRRVKSVSDVEWNDSVFNLSVVGDESYIADGVGVHNCAMFVSWCSDRVGIKFHYAYCPYIEADATAGRNGLSLIGQTAVNASEDPVVALFHFGSGEAKHIGIVERVDLEDGTVTCIEGNTSSGETGSQDNGGVVARRTRPLSHVRRFVAIEV